MQTSFPPDSLADPDTAAAEAAIRKCVHCGFCTATCPTYLLTGDELDGPRGRIYLMKTMLETGAAPTPTVVRHVDRCLSCLSCKSTCPSGVDYAHLVDHARAYIETRYRRPVGERVLRWLLAQVLPNPGRLRLALRLAPLGQPFARTLRRVPGLAAIGAMLLLAPRRLATAEAAAAAETAAAARGRVVVLQGCAEPVLRPQVRAATTRLLRRAGFEVVTAPAEGCCGALVQHMGRKADALAAARRNVDAWTKIIEAGGLDAILVTASGCGTTVKEYGRVLQADPRYAEPAARVSRLAKDICEFLDTIDLPPPRRRALPRVAYHAACALQHGQGIREAPLRLLRGAGFEVRTPPQAHLCCGSAGVFNILQPDLAEALGARKAAGLDGLQADVVAAGNIGCITQLARWSRRPVVHSVELLDWAYGGPAPDGVTQTLNKQRPPA